MADSGRALKRGAGLAARLRVRKARSQLLLSRRCRRRLGTVRRCERRRLRRRLLLARAAGVDWRDACKPLARKPRAARPLATPDPAPARDRTPSPTPCRSVCTHLLTEPFRMLGPGRAMIVLAAEKSFTFSGICRVTCLYGQVEVFGHTMNQGQPGQDVFSTYTNAYLTINALRYSTPEKSKKEIKRELRAQFKSHLKMDDRRWAIEHFSPLCSIVMLEKLQTSTVDFLNSYPGISYVFLQEPPPSRTKYEYLIWKCLGIVKQKSKKSFCLSESALLAVEELVSVSCEVDTCPIILVCGPQDIGKSTFNRYLINQLLNSISCIDYLECDLGQTEFTPPGCISLLTVTEPVLGPPFTHQRVPQKMVYFGKTTCYNDCNSYIEVVKYVFSAYKRDSPLIINTMGWMSDDGLLLLVDLIRLLAPSHVVQLTSHYTRHLPLLTLHYVDSTDGLYTKCRSRRKFRGFEIPEFGDNLDFIDEEKDSSPLPCSGHKLVCVNSEFPCSKNPRNRDSYNRIFRDLAVLGYLSQLMPAVPKPLSPLHGLTPYQVPFSAVALRITHSDVAPTHILYAMNASWLGLCQIMDDVRGYTKGPILLAQTPICDCLGFGLCRGVDMDRQLYHILTPLPPEDLRTVNCLLIGCVSIPQCLLKSQPGLEGTIPYVTTDYNFKLPGASEKIGVREAEEYEDHPFAKYRFYQKIRQSEKSLSYQSSLFSELGPDAGRLGGPHCLLQSVEP